MCVKMNTVIILLYVLHYFKFDLFLFFNLCFQAQLNFVYLNIDWHGVQVIISLDNTPDKTKCLCHGCVFMNIVFSDRIFAIDYL